VTAERTAERTDRGAKALAWWGELRGDPDTGRPGDRAAMARLRRAASIVEAMAEPAVLDLYRRLGFGPAPCEARVRLPTVAVVAMVLAHVRECEARHPARTIGLRTPSDDDPPLKPLRFRRLLTIDDDEELVRDMRRLVAIADRKVDVAGLARALLQWNDPERRDRVRADWAFHYYAAGEAAPAAAD